MSLRVSASALMLSTALAGAPMAARAQATTITPDMGAALSLGTTALRTGNVVTIDGGTLAGANLFHSFSQFSLAAGETAQWVRAGGGAGVSNVINRVTGGEVSQIAGTLDSTFLPNANFYFINPAGVVFGAGARVNVPAAAWFSTASELRFADGRRFSMATPGGSTLSVAAPESFGFVGGQGAIAIDGAVAATAPASAALSFIGSDVRVANSQLIVRGLDLVGIGNGAATVRLADPLASVAGGSVNVRNSQLVVTASGGTGSLRIGGGDVTLDTALLVSDTEVATRGGDIRIAASQLHLTGSQIGASTRGPGAGGAVTITAGDVVGQGGSLYTIATGAGAGGRFAISADTINLTGVTISSNSTGTGTGGDLELSARTLAADSSYLISNSLGPGAGGSVRITAPSMDLVNAIAVASASGTGRPGDVTLSGDDISLSAGVYGSSPGTVSDSGNLTITATSSFQSFGGIFSVPTYSDGAAGGIRITAPDLFLQDTFIDTNAYGDGAVGTVSLQGQHIVLDHAQITAEARGASNGRVGLVQLKATGRIDLLGALITSNAYGAATGGTIVIEGHDVLLDDATVTSDSTSAGDGGEVSVKATNLVVHNGGVSSNAFSSGDAGDVTLEARSITLDTATAIASDTFDAGNAGQVIVKGGSVVMTDGASITSKAKSGMGDAGGVLISVDSLSLADASISSDTDGLGKAGAVTIRVGDLLLAGQRRGFTYISSDTLGSGNAGDVSIDAHSILLRDQGYISSNSAGSSEGNAGRVTIRTDTLTVRDGAFIASDTNSSGHAGDVSIIAGDLRLEGGGPGSVITYISSDSFGDNAGKVSIEAKTLSVKNGAFISSDTYAFGAGGDVIIKAGAIVLDTNGNIRSGTFSNGGAGNVSVNATTLSLDNGAAVSSEAYAKSTGNAGVIGIVADSLTIGDQARVSTSSGGEGDAGTVTLKTKTLSVDGGLVSSAAVVGATGASGALNITADAVSLVNGGSISTVSNNTQRAGQIGITTGALSIDGAGSGISSENQAGNTALGNRRGQSGAAGGIRLTANDLSVANGGRISTNAFAGAAGEIDIAMPSEALLILKGATAPGSIETSSGSGTGGRISIGSPLAIVSNGGSILALGELRGANVAIQTKYFINSADRINTLAVDGAFQLVATTYDVSSGTVTRDLSVLDASKILRGQCPVTRSTGVVSQLITRPVGPYVREPAFEALQRKLDSLQLSVGGCR